MMGNISGFLRSDFAIFFNAGEIVKRKSDNQSQNLSILYLETMQV